jgi:hypothetical protein
MDQQLLLQYENFMLQTNLISANGEIPNHFQLLPFPVTTALFWNGRWQLHIEFCDLSHSQYPDFA